MDIVLFFDYNYYYIDTESAALLSSALLLNHFKEKKGIINVK